MRTKTVGLSGPQRPILNGLPMAQGTHLRFNEDGKVANGSHLYFDDDGQVLTPASRGQLSKATPPPSSEKIRLKGLPTPKGHHTRWM